MRTVIIILAVLSILLLITAGTFGYNLQMGFLGERTDKFATAHKHSATTAAILSLITHLLTILYCRRNAKA